MEPKSSSMTAGEEWFSGDRMECGATGNYADITNGGGKDRVSQWNARCCIYVCPLVTFKYVQAVIGSISFCL